MLLWIAVSALATEDAIQVRAFPGAVAFAEAHAEALDPSWAYDDLYAEAVSCYDVVGIRDFNLSVPIDEVSLTLGPDTLTVQVDFGLIRGEDMNLYSYDSEWTDLCAEFDTTIYYAQISGASVTAPLEIAPPGFADLFSGTDLSFQWAEPPELTGDIETDIAWVPDSLVLFFIEDALREAALDALTETLPPLLGALLGEAAYAGEYGGLAAALDLTDATLDPEHLSLYVDASLAAASSETCEIGAAGSGPAPTGLAQERLPLDAADDADLGVALTEALMGEGLHAAWEAGWFCVEADSVRELLDGLALWVDPDVAQLSGWATLDSPPRLSATPDGLALVIPDVRVEITGRLDGEPVTLVTLQMDIEGTATPGFDQDLTAMTLSLVEPTFDFHSLTLDHIPGGDAVVPFVEAELEAWAADWARDSLDRVVLFDALYYLWDIALLLDHTVPRDGGIELYFALYSTDDPAVDTVAPDTTVEVRRQTRRKATLVASGTDDRDEPLAYAWQVDGGGWSAFDLETEFTVDALAEGEHLVEVVARDRWLNIDPSPARAILQIEPVDPANSGCLGCRNGNAPIGPGWLLIGILVGWRRRPAADRGPRRCEPILQ